MKISELRGEKQNRDHLGRLTRQGAADELISHQGFRPVEGPKGAHSSVIFHPNLDYVIKLFDANDSGYRLFLDVARNHQGNEHFPRIRGRPMRLSQNVIGIRLERLEDFMSWDKFKSISEMLDHASWSDNWQAGLRPDSSAMEFLLRWPHFATALDILRRAAKPHGVRFDWHLGNIMLRSNHSPVIIDPFAS